MHSSGLYWCYYLFDNLLGLSKKSTNFLGAAPSLRANLKNNCQTKNFKELLVDSATESIQFQPRNARQIKYYKEKTSTRTRIGSDAILNVHELAYAIPEFVWSVRTYPDLVVCFGLPEFIEILHCCSVCLLSYDTTFNLGDFYLSVLVVRLTIEEEAPCIPIAFVLHERKFNTVHEEFFHQFNQRLKRTINAYIVTDGEQAIVKAVKEKLPSWHMMTCWNHLLRDVEAWVKKHQGSSSDVIIYKGNIREILESSSVEQFASKEATLEPSWSEPFRLYYAEHLRSRLQTSYTGHLHEIGLEVNSITNNMSESMNNVIKSFNGWRENTPDLCLLSLYRLQVYYKTQITRSELGFGPYTPVNAGLITGK
jgi:hypothetical protein